MKRTPSYTIIIATMLKISIQLVFKYFGANTSLTSPRATITLFSLNIWPLIGSFLFILYTWFMTFSALSKSPIVLYQRADSGNHNTAMLTIHDQIAVAKTYILQPVSKSSCPIAIHARITDIIPPSVQDANIITMFLDRAFTGENSITRVNVTGEIHPKPDKNRNTSKYQILFVKMIAVVETAIRFVLIIVTSTR